MNDYRVTYKDGYSFNRDTIVSAEEFKTKDGWLIAFAYGAEGVEVEKGRWLEQIVLQVVMIGPTP